MIEKGTIRLKKDWKSHQKRLKGNKKKRLKKDWKGKYKQLKGWTKKLKEVERVKKNDWTKRSKG